MAAPAPKLRQHCASPPAATLAQIVWPIFVFEKLKPRRQFHFALEKRDGIRSKTPRQRHVVMTGTGAIFVADVERRDFVPVGRLTWRSMPIIR